MFWLIRQCDRGPSFLGTLLLGATRTHASGHFRAWSVCLALISVLPEISSFHRPFLPPCVPEM